MKMWMQAICVTLLLSTSAAYAHVGSPDVYAEGKAGPYKLSVVVRPPLVIPGVAEIDVRAETAGINHINITPVPLVGEARWSRRSAPYWRCWASSSCREWPASWARLPAKECSLPAANRRRGYIAKAVTLALLAVVVLLGNRWWKADAASYAENIYKPLQMCPALEHWNLLDLKLTDPGWLLQRQLDDFIPDHNHLMHLYMIRWPQMDVVYHLHPDPVGTGEFQLALPSMPPGDYHLYADVVHANGFPETLVAAMVLPEVAGRPLTGDDTEGLSKPVMTAELDRGRSVHEEKFALPDGYTMVWKMTDALVAKAAEDFRFELLDRAGKPPADMALYMGMLGHAAFVKTDGTVFAHVHPTGTVAMAAFMMANPQASMSGMSNRPTMNISNMRGMDMNSTALPNAVSFPYGFPSAGEYRIFIQMKHGSTVETGVFDVQVRAPAA